MYRRREEEIEAGQRRCVCLPVDRQDVEGRRFVTQVVHLFDRDGHAALGHYLLVLRGRAFERLPHVDVLQRDWGQGEREEQKETRRTRAREGEMEREKRKIVVVRVPGREESS